MLLGDAAAGLVAVPAVVVNDDDVRVDDEETCLFVVSFVCLSLKVVFVNLADLFGDNNGFVFDVLLLVFVIGKVGVRGFIVGGTADLDVVVVTL